MNFIDRLTILLKENNITAKSLTQTIGISQTSVSDWKRGKSSPSIKTLIDISKFFNISIDWLLTGEIYSENIAVSGNVSGNNNIVNSNHSSVVVRNGQEHPLSDEVCEIIRIYEALDVRRRIKLLNTAFSLEEETKGGNN